MATSLTQAIRKTLECPVCQSFFKDPKILTCSHTFCKGCLESLLASHRNIDVLLCPTCRGETWVPRGDVGKLQSNITVRSLVEDVETKGHSNCNQENKSLQRKWNKCKKHPNYEEECFCLDCNKYVCFKCGTLEHTMNAHTILEAGVHETVQTNNVDDLASKADAKIREVDKYASFLADQRTMVHNVQEQHKGKIDETYEESVQILNERKTVLRNEVEHGQLGKLKISLGDMEESSLKQKNEIKKVLELVKNGLNFPLQTEALTSHKAKCQQLEELLSRIGPDEELSIRKCVEDCVRICFSDQGSNGLQLCRLVQNESKWVLRTEDPLPIKNSMSGMVISPNNEMAVGCRSGGIFIYSSEGIIQETVLNSVKVLALDIMPDVGYVIRDTNNRISLYTELCENLDVTFETMDVANGRLGGLTVGKYGTIFIGYNVCSKIQVFKPEGGKAIREIKCNGFIPWQMFAMTSSQAILVKSSWNKVQVINDVSGAIIHSISKAGEDPYPALYQDNSVIIAWVKHDQGLLSIIHYTMELKYIKNILTDVEMINPIRAWCHLQAFKTGVIAFCTFDRVYIFHETWE